MAERRTVRVCRMRHFNFNPCAFVRRAKALFRIQQKALRIHAHAVQTQQP